MDEADIGEDVIKLVNKVLAEAFIRKASDIHVEPYEHIFEFGSGSMEPFKKFLSFNPKLIHLISRRRSSHKWIFPKDANKTGESN